jgi:hypothetical protein
LVVRHYEESPTNNIPHSDQRKVTYRQLGLALLLAVLLLVGTNIGTSYLGAKLALDFGESLSSTTRSEERHWTLCFEDVHLEFKIRFDSNPGEWSCSSWADPCGTLGGAFFSSSQFQRENIFSVCLSPALPYNSS